MKNKIGMTRVRLHSGTVVEVTDWKGKPYPSLYGTSSADVNGMKNFLVDRVMIGFLQSSIVDQLVNGGFDGTATNGVFVTLRKPWTSMVHDKRIEIQVSCDLGVREIMTAYGEPSSRRMALHNLLMGCQFYLDVLRATILGEPFERGTSLEDMQGMIVLMASEYTEDPNYVGNFLNDLMRVTQFKQAVETAEGQIHYRVRSHIKQLITDKRLTSQYKVA